MKEESSDERFLALSQREFRAIDVEENGYIPSTKLNEVQQNGCFYVVT